MLQSLSYLEALVKAVMFRTIKICLVACLAISIAACSEKHEVAQVGYISTKSLQEAAEAAGIGSVRMQALRDTAATLGTQGGLAWRAEHVDRALKSEADYLDQVFNFNQLMLKHNVLPPVLAYADKPLNLDSDSSIRLADKIYNIISQARFVTVPPTWRDYLWLSYTKPRVPNHSLLPKGHKEVRYWNTFLRKGWKRGLQQGNQIFAANLARLKRDMAGMILYHKLLAEHMVSAPFVAKADLGITGDSHQLRINDQVLRITSQSQLQTDSNQWSPVLTKGTKG
ncbi:MAG: type IV secretion system DotC family protein [Coxiellaceae bacterium]|nr:type IV secretion system DotC family protein [Coxiellaceae bacterium]